MPCCSAGTRSLDLLDLLQKVEPSDRMTHSSEWKNLIKASHNLVWPKIVVTFAYHTQPTTMMTTCIFLFLFATGSVQGFQIPHPGHHHPLYVRYRQEQLDQYHHQSNKNNNRQHTPSVPHLSPDLVTAHGTAFALSEDTDYTYTTNTQNTYAYAYAEEECLIDQYQQQQQQQHRVSMTPLDQVTLSTPISYDEETGMVQTAVRAIVQNPLASLVDNAVVGLSSTLVITTSALHEVAHCLELEWTHHATSSTESLALLSLGHFLHYGREAIRQLAELNESKDEEEEEEKIISNA